MPKQPQDRRPKANGAYTFRHAGKTFTLPSAEDVDLPGRFTRDAIMDGEEGQARLGFALLEKVATTEAQDALYDMPTSVMLERIREWLEFKGSPEDASLGESSSSST